MDLSSASGGTQSTCSRSSATAATSSSDNDTLASFVTDYVRENNRRYHAYQAGSYWGPNDEAASEMQDLSHAMYVLTLDGALFLAPIGKNPKQILDVGTGNGLWAIEMADQYPDAVVTGNDLSPIQPELVPVNCVFEVDDANLEWTWEDDYFDFVHVRELFGSITDWEAFAKEALRCIKPGGYMEIVEHSHWAFSDDGSLKPNSVLDIWAHRIDKVFQDWGKSFNIWKESKSVLSKSGFIDIVEKRYKWPLNEWPTDPKLKQIGGLNMIRVADNLDAFTMRILTTTGKMTPEEAQVHLAQVRTAVKDPEVHAYIEVTVVYGKKPC